jgi:hypothetical protein
MMHFVADEKLQDEGDHTEDYMESGQRVLLSWC